MIPQRQPIRIRTPGRRTRPIQHLRDLNLGQRLRQNLPARRHLHIHRRVIRDPLIHQQPPIKPAQTAQLPCNRPRLHPMPPQPFHKPTHIRLHRRHQQPIPSFDMLGKLLHIPLVRLTASWTQPLLHPQIPYELPHQSHIARDLARILHRSRLSCLATSTSSPTQRLVPTWLSTKYATCQPAITMACRPDPLRGERSLREGYTPFGPRLPLVATRKSHRRPTGGPGQSRYTSHEVTAARAGRLIKSAEHPPAGLYSQKPPSTPDTPAAAHSPHPASSSPRRSTSAPPQPDSPSTAPSASPQ